MNNLKHRARMALRRRQLLEGSILWFASFVLVAQLLPTAFGYIVPGGHTKSLTCMPQKVSLSSCGLRFLDEALYKCPSRRPSSRMLTLQSIASPGQRPSMSPRPLWSQISPSLFRSTRWKQPRIGALSSAVRKASIPLLISLISMPRQAWAASSFVQVAKHKLPSIRAAWKIVKISLVVILVIRQLRLRKRQSLDATSEWARYAKYPSTRGRALGSLLCFQLFPLWLSTRILQLVGQKERADRMRIRAGNVFADGLLRLG
jgi:hypothetical protein